ncbi:MAG: PEP-CTERM sorting domain-containing protein [Edaphobacter sp.]
MFKVKSAALALGLCALASLPLAAKADTLTYDFTYTGTGVFTNGETASGSGTFTISFDSLNAPTLEDFSFNDTLTVGKSQSSFTYSLMDFGTSSIVLSGTLADPFLANLQIQTNAVTGSDSSFGPASFGFAYASVNPAAGNTLGTSGAFTDDFTTGTVVLGQPSLQTTSTVPEPATYALLATGLIGIAFLFRRTQVSNQI